MQLARVLYVEDDEDDRLFFARFVEDSGILFDFDVAADAKEASAFLDKHRYQLVLLDINLPGDNGFQWVQSEKERLADTPVFALTTSRSFKDHHEAIRLLDDYINKPLRPTELFMKIQAVEYRGTKFAFVVTES
jgi:DNA-binding response OmpR family regulator